MAGSGSRHNTTTVHDILVKSARSGLELQRDDGSFPPGRNYPYDERETPVRSTAEWLRIMVEANQITGDPEFEAAGNAAVDYLLTDEARPHGYTYHNRDVQEKDRCNGLVGQSWPIRSLSIAADAFGRDEARNAALEVFCLHPFDDKIGLWEKVEINGENLSFDRTLNHQLLFAGAAAPLAPWSSTVRNRLERFLDTLANNMFVHSNGRIAHYVRPPLRRVVGAVLRGLRHSVLIRNEASFNYHRFSETRRKKERGYHVTNLAGMVALKQAFPSHEFWDGDLFRRTLQFIHEHESELVRRHKVTHGSTLQGIALARVRYGLEDVPVNALVKLIASDLRSDPTRGPHPFRQLDVGENTALTLVSPLIDLPNVEVTPNPSS